MKKITTYFSMILLAVFSWHTQAQTGGNTCADAVDVTPGIYSDAFIVADSAGSANANDGGADAIWYSYTATADGTININSCDSDPSGVDTRLFLYDGDCTNLNPIDNDDDGCDAPNGFGSSLEEIPVVSGTTYYIEWDDRWEEAPFDWTLEFVPPPTCPEVTNIMVTQGTFDAVITWDEVAEATSGYIVNVFNFGDDPTMAAPVYTEMVPAGTLTTTATGLMESTFYDLYIIADCGAGGLSSIDDSVFFATLVACPPVQNFVADMITTTEITFSWDEVTNVENGYTLNVFNTGADPMVDPPVYTEMIAAGITSTTATGLVEDTSYDAIITADCGATNGMSFPTTITVITAFEVDESCGGVYLDSGGLSSGYSSDELTTTTIMPDFPGQIVTVTFTYVDIEAAGGNGTQDGCWDFLTVYDGPDTMSPVLAMTLCGEESGDGDMPSVPESNLAIGTSFTSTHSSGALTFVFTSDGIIEETGWEADITCEGPECVAPENFTNDNVTETTADFSWDAVMDVEGYVFAVFEDGANPDPNTGDAPVFSSELITTTSGTADGLLPNTSYDAYIVTVCDATTDPENPVFSDITGPVDFTTAILSINDVEFTNFTISPNPASEILNITNDRTIDSIEIYNMLGQRVLSNTSNATNISLDVSNLSNGAYFVKATVEGNSATQKFIKN